MNFSRWLTGLCIVLLAAEAFAVGLREEAPDFTLKSLDGGNLRLEEYRGQVVLINFWASWCAPCREEMPALDSLRRSIDDPDFLFVTMNEDVKVSEARAFIDEFGFDHLPVLLGKGKLRQRYHYYGLPLTVLVDREGRTVQRWIGFAGEEQIAGIRAVIKAELLRGPGGSEVAGHEGHREH